ncbi:MAG: endonuclease/exonuclease/phosphatase family protein [Myxococcales bacterium]|nr:endonuclease/exonuclease/phosphatase family protein [Myxococcales bacterium]
MSSDAAVRHARRVLMCLLCALLWSGCTATGDKHGAVRLMSWNVARGYAFAPPVVHSWLPDRWTLAGAFKEDPRIQQADIIALQEVCGEAGARHVGWIAAALNTPHVYFHKADKDRDGACGEGQAIVSRYPIRAAGELVLPAVKTMTRTAVWVTVALPSPEGERLVRIWNVHLDHSATKVSPTKGRQIQLAAVLDQVDVHRNRQPEDGVLLAGDFNTLEGDEPVLKDAELLMDAALPGDQATHVLGWRLDHVYFAHLVRRHADVVALPGSDHFALLADFDLVGEASGR